jgi:hypothetical protein
MKKSAAQSAFFNRRILLSFVLCSAGLLLALFGLGALPKGSVLAQTPNENQKAGMQVVASYRNDVSPALRDVAPLFPLAAPKEEREANPNPKVPSHHKDAPDAVVQRRLLAEAVGPNLPSTILNFDGIPFPGVGCNCSPPDPNGAIGKTQYVQIVNEGYQVFDKITSDSQLGPVGIASIWSGFGGVCQNNGHGDPIVLYDRLADRWIISQFAGVNFATDECIAVSTTSDATGSYFRYGFHLGSSFFDYPHLSTWPDAYYMSMNVFDTTGQSYMGPQPFAFDRAKMLNGQPATFVTTAGALGGTVDPFLPADLDGSALPPAGAPNTFVAFPGGGQYITYHFHVDFATPANSTFTTFAAPAAAPFTELCSTTRSCVPQPNTSVGLDGIGDRLMFRLAYRRFSDHESVVGNYSVSSGGVAGVRWFELRNVTGGPVTLFQESTYQPDSTWRWMASAAMDSAGNIAVGFSASSASLFPSIRYAGRLASDPINTLGQGETTLIAGGGSQTSTANRWGDYSDLTIDPVDDCTFWYTNEYYTATDTVNWKTRIGNFKFPTCTSQPVPVVTKGSSSVALADPDGVLFPGATVTVSLGLRNVGTGCTPGSVIATLQPSGGVVNPTPASQSYGTLCPSGGVVQNFTFTVSPSLACGSTVTASLSVTDGTNNYGTFTYTFPVGFPKIAFAENFDGVTPPALPVGWTPSNAAGPAPLWVTSATSPDTAPNDAFVDDPSTISDKRLDTPAVSISSASAQLSFRNNFNLESNGGTYFDGSVLEVSAPNINGGTFTDITDAAVGASFVSGGYVGVINSSFGNPIAGRNAWSGNSGGYVSTVGNLGPNLAGQTIKLRFRMGSDNSVSASGWRIDSISISDGALCVPLKILSITRTNGQTLLQGVGIPNTSHTIQASLSPSSSGFAKIGSTTADGAGQWQFTDGAANTNRFYRLTYP